MTTFRNLTKESPRSPRNRLAGYALMARMIDKGRASIEGNVGEYHYACPLDQMLFEFKGVKTDEVKKLLGSGATDEHAARYDSSRCRAASGTGSPKNARTFSGAPTSSSSRGPSCSVRSAASRNDCSQNRCRPLRSPAGSC